jgi:murein DD-endopeptidase MepM/ murein hydrolase activator NlpD
VIGYVGSSGRSTSPHVHYELMLNGRTVNPMKLLGR